MKELLKNRRILWAVIAVLVVTVGVLLFVISNDKGREDSTATPEEIAEETLAPSQNIVETVEDDTQFSTLASALQAADLTEKLAGEGPFTLFAPTDDSFATAFEELETSSDEFLAKDDLEHILSYHIVEGELFAADIVELDDTELETLNGQTVTIKVEDGILFVNDSQLITMNIQTTNGIIHIIQSVLLPS